MLKLKDRSQHLVSLIQQRAEKFPNRRACLSLPNETLENIYLTYSELDKKAKVVAAFLQQKNLAGERVILLYPSGLDFIVAFMGCLYAGVIAVPITCPKLSQFEKSHDFINAITADADVSGIFTTEDYLEKIKICCKSSSLFFHDINEFTENLFEKYRLPKLTKQTIAYLQYTSGSTSTPKAAIISHENILHSVKHLAKTWHYTAKSITLTWAPHSHVYGLICGILTPLYQGSLAIVMPASLFVARPLTWLEAISQYKVTHSGCPNFGYDLCVQTIEEKSLEYLNLESWIVACNGGELVQAATIKSFAEKFKKFGFSLNHFCSAYGMSEVTGPIAVGSYKEDPVEFKLALEDLKTNTVKFSKAENARRLMGNGHFLSGLKAVVVDPETLRPVKKGKIGEIWLAGNSVASGYWCRPKETKEIFQATLPRSNKHFFRTGDLGFISDKELCLVGRLKELIVVYGKKYYPLDIETSIAFTLKNFNVANCRAAFGININNEEKLVILQEVNDEFKNSDSETIINCIRKTVTDIYNLDTYEIILVKENSLPKTASGKLQRNKCKLLFQENKLDVVIQKSKEKTSTTNVAPMLEEKFLHDFVSVLSDVLQVNAHDIKLKNSISEYGFDSIKIVTVTTRLNQLFGVNLTPAIIFEFKTLGEFLENFMGNNIQKLLAHYSLDEEVQLKEDIELEKSPAQMTTTEIAIVGLSGIFPNANNVEEFWQNLIAGKNAIREIPSDRWQWQQYTDEKNPALKWGGFVPDIAGFDANFFNISPREAELIDPQQRLFLQVAWNAIEDAGYAVEAVAAKKTGLFVGAFSNNYAELLNKHDITDAYMTTGVTQSMLANRVSYLLNLSGPSETIDTACSSSLVAIHHAVRAIQNGDCEMAIAGGVNAIITPNAYISANQAGMLSRDGQCHTFDKDANGYVRAEGVAAILLKPLARALEAGDHIYGVIKGSAINHGGHVSSLTVPNPNAQAEVIIEACKRANIAADSIGYIETHGTGTPLGDPVEVNGLKKAFTFFKAEHTHKQCALGALKTHIGHLESAAGIAGVVKVLLAMQHKTLPGNLNFKALNPYIDLNESPFYILDKTQSWQKIEDDMPRRAGVSSFGFGGTNAHVIIEEYDSSSIQEEKAAHLITLSAKSAHALKARIQDLQAWLNKNNSSSLTAIAFTLNQGRTHFNKRCAIVAESIEELHASLKQIVEGRLPENAVMNLEGQENLANRPIFQALFKQLLVEIQQADLSNTDYRKKLLALSDLYIDGYELDWSLFQFNHPQRLSLPTYPFENKHYWIPVTTQTIETAIHKPQPENPTEDLVKLIEKSLLANVAELLKLDPQAVSISNSLSEQGFDSIAFSLLHLQLEEYYKVKLNPALFFTHNTIAALSKHFLETYPNEMQQVHQLTQRLHEILESSSNELAREKTQIKEPIAIIGMHGVMPKSADLAEFWEHLIAGDNLITEIPQERWDFTKHFDDSKLNAKKTNSKWGGFIPDVDKFDANFFNLSSREANLLDPQHRLFLETAWKTIEDAGYDPFAFSGQDIGVFVGVEFNEYQNLILDYASEAHGFIATGNAHAMLPNRVSYFLNLRGPSEAIDTACSSAFVAINRAIHAIQQGECSLAVAGGVNLLLSPQTYVVASQLAVLSSDGACKTFDKSANGYVRGEGVGALLLKPLSKAIKDNDSIYAVIKSSVVKHGGKAQSITAPNVTAQSQLLIKAYSEANVDPNTVTFIETHGTGTSLGDPVEIEGIKSAFATLLGSKQQSQNAYCGLGAVKTQVGHLEPASGMAGILKVILAMRHAILPGNLHLKELNEHIDLAQTPFYLLNKTQSWEHLQDAEGKVIPYRAGVSSFGFGGTIAHLVLEEYISDPSSFQVSKPSYLLSFSAKNVISLRQKLIDLHFWLKNHKTSLADLSYTLNTGRTHFKYRAAIVVKSVEELQATLQACINDQSPVNYFQSDKQENNTLDLRIKEVMAALGSPKEAEEYHRNLLLLAEFYVKQQSINWQRLYDNEKVQRLHIPTYPFNKQRYWFDLEMINKPIEASRSSNLTLTYLQKVFASVLRLAPEQIKPDVTYEEYGIDSLLGLEIIGKIEKDYGQIPKTILFEKTTLSALADYLSSFKRQPDTNIHKGVSENSLPGSDIAIIGLAGHYPSAETINEFWHNLMTGKDCVGEIPADRWNYQDYPIHAGTEDKYFNHGGFLTDVDKFDPLFFNISPRDAAFMDPQERLFLQTAWETLEDAGYTRERLQKLVRNKVGVFAGVTHHFYPIYAAEEWAKGNRIPINTQIFSIANRVSYFLNLNGPSYAIDTACSSSLSAIHLAVESLQRGECEMAIAGGVNLSLHPSKYHMLGSYNFLSEQGRCASFAEGGAGYVPSEGVGAVLLKPLSLAVRDNDRILAVIKASSTNHGGKTSGYTVPDPNAHAELIKTTLEKANINPRTISYVEAHGTGTALGDPIEIRGLQSAYENYTQDKQFCAIGSVKSNIGHLEAAAGISQLTKVILQMQHKKLVPSLHAEKLNPYIDFTQTPFVVQRQLSDWATELRRAGISSFGAGGTNVHMIVDEIKENNLQNEADVNTPFIFVLSAMTDDRLLALAECMYEFIHNTVHTVDDVSWLQSICYTLQIGREAMPVRLAFVVNTVNELLTALKGFIRGEKRQELQYVDVDKWLKGEKINWEKYYTCKQKIISLPTYPFAKRHCWIPTVEAKDDSIPVKAADKNLYALQWNLPSRDHQGASQDRTVTLPDGRGSEKWLIFSDYELGFVLQNELGKENCIYCFTGDEFNVHDANTFYINPKQEIDYENLIKQVTSQHQLKGIIYLWPMLNEQTTENLFFLLKTLSKNPPNQKLLFSLITRGSQAVTKLDTVEISQYPLWAMTRFLSLENGNYDVMLLDLDTNISLHQEAKIISTELHQFNNNENQIAYRDNNRYQLCLTNCDEEEKSWQYPEAALITGGLGALGSEVATWLAQQGTQYLLLTGTSALPDRLLWEAESNSRIKEKLDMLKKLEATGVNIIYEVADVADIKAMQEVIHKAENTWKKPITGVFHLSGITTASIPLETMTSEILAKVLHAKVNGALVLNELFSQNNLNCFVLFSSIASLPYFGVKGMSAYATANAFLDGLALHRKAKGLPAISINWAAWAEKGMGKDHDHTKFLDAVGMSALTVSEATEYFSALMKMQSAQVAVMNVDWHKFLRVNLHAKQLGFFANFTDKTPVKENNAAPLDEASLRSLILHELAALLLIGENEIDVNTDFQNYGVDSIVGINFVAKINEKLGEVLSPMDLYRYPTLNKLNEYTKELVLPKKTGTTDLTINEISELIKKELSELDDL